MESQKQKTRSDPTFSKIIYLLKWIHHKNLKILRLEELVKDRRWSSFPTLNLKLVWSPQFLTVDLIDQIEQNDNTFNENDVEEVDQLEGDQGKSWSWL